MIGRYKFILHFWGYVPLEKRASHADIDQGRIFALAHLFVMMVDKNGLYSARLNSCKRCNQIVRCNFCVIH